MGGVYRRSRVHHGRKELYKKYRLRRRTKDLDQIQDDLLPENTSRVLLEALDEDRPGGGQFLCVECSRHFIDQKTLDEHKGTKNHKKRLRGLSEPAYTIEEANAAGGSGTGEFYATRVAKLTAGARTHLAKRQKQATTTVGETDLMSYE